MSTQADLEHVLLADPEIMHGELCFLGTRVPVRLLLEYVQAGDSIEDFSEDYPSVPMEFIAEVLRARCETPQRGPDTSCS